MKKLFTTLCLAVVGLLATTPLRAKDGDQFQDGSFSFEILSETYKTVSLIRATAEGEVKIPSEVLFNYVTYSVTTIGDNAFSECYSITSIEIPESVSLIGDSAFNYCTSLTSVEIPESVTIIGVGAFSNCISLTSVKIPESVTIIGDFAFSYCYSLTSVEIPNSVTTIGFAAFYNCTALTSVEIPESVTIIGDNIFFNCNSLTSVEIPESVTTIGDYAFSHCYSLTSVEIPESMTTIGNNAFDNCTALKKVICYAKKIPMIGSYCFNEISTDVVLYVYADVIGNYKNSDWTQYFSIILPIDDSRVGSLSDTDAIDSYKVYNLNGLNVLDTKVKSDLNNLPSGFYIFKGKKVMISK